MKKLGKLSISVNKIIKNEELVNLKGGEYGYTVHDLCNPYTYCICCRTSAQGGIEFCQEESGFAVLDAWASYWVAAGYTVECDRVMWA